MGMSVLKNAWTFALIGESSKITKFHFSGMLCSLYQLYVIYKKEPDAFGDTHTLIL